MRPYYNSPNKQDCFVCAITRCFFCWFIIGFVLPLKTFLQPSHEHPRIPRQMLQKPALESSKHVPQTSPNLPKASPKSKQIQVPLRGVVSPIDRANNSTNGSNSQVHRGRLSYQWNSKRNHLIFSISKSDSTSKFTYIFK